MIEVTITGVPPERFTRPMPADADGAVRFNLADDHSLVDLFDKLNKLLGVEPSPESQARADAVEKQRAYRMSVQRVLNCERAKRGCPHPWTCDRLRKCQAWPW